MNVLEKAKFISDWIKNYVDNMPSKAQSLVIGISGGIDSSLITALLQKVSSSAVETFSVGYEEDSHNEAPYASKIATHLGTKHNELILSARDLIDTIPSLQSLFWLSRWLLRR